MVEASAEAKVHSQTHTHTHRVVDPQDKLNHVLFSLSTFMVNLRLKYVRMDLSHSIVCLLRIYRAPICHYIIPIRIHKIFDTTGISFALNKAFSFSYSINIYIITLSISCSERTRKHTSHRTPISSIPFHCEKKNQNTKHEIKSLPKKKQNHTKFVYMAGTAPCTLLIGIIDCSLLASFSYYILPLFWLGYEI